MPVFSMVRTNIFLSAASLGPPFEAPIGVPFEFEMAAGCAGSSAECLSEFLRKSFFEMSVEIVIEPPRLLYRTAFSITMNRHSLTLQQSIFNAGQLESSVG